MPRKIKRPLKQEKDKRTKTDIFIEVVSLRSRISVLNNLITDKNLSLAESRELGARQAERIERLEALNRLANKGEERLQGELRLAREECIELQGEIDTLGLDVTRVTHLAMAAIAPFARGRTPDEFEAEIRKMLKRIVERMEGEENEMIDDERLRWILGAGYCTGVIFGERPVTVDVPTPTAEAKDRLCSLVEAIESGMVETAKEIVEKLTLAELNLLQDDECGCIVHAAVKEKLAKM